MSFFFKSCFEAQIEPDHEFQKQLDPRVSILPN